jgi:RimJ/RimL family protein N-acetyltransferase
VIVEAGPQDRDLVEALLLPQLEGAMFPLSNLRAHGLRAGGYASDHPHASRFWIVGGRGVIALTRGGMLQTVLDPDCDLTPLSGVLAGRTVEGAVGPALAIRPVLRALRLQDRPARLDADEPGFALDLADLRRPDPAGAILVPAASVPRDLLVAWRAAATVETQGMPEAEAEGRAARDIDGWLERDSHRVLLHHGRPVALTGFNARLPEIVQIGGVYTPPALRNRGFARTAVALHLAEAREEGCTRAVLFAVSPAAARAYRALGFRPTADFTLVLYDEPVTLPP